MCGCRAVLAVTAIPNNIGKWEEHHVRGRGGEGGEGGRRRGGKKQKRRRVKVMMAVL